MQLSSDVLSRVSYLSGSAELASQLPSIPALIPFDERVVDFLNDVSRELMGNRAARAFSDVITFAFWIRKSSVMKLKKRFEHNNEAFYLGKGTVFHIAPSNVPCNFAYSLVAGLLSGNANVVRASSKDFTQVSIIVEAINKALEKHAAMQPYVLIVRYGRDRDINDMFSSIANMRVIWGGDQTIAEIRKSPLPARSGEITFADRYSLAVIDSDYYMDIEDKAHLAEDFYNDTFFSDQNACTSPRIVIWTGNQVIEAKRLFWEEEHKYAENKYSFQAIQSVNKLTSSYLIAVAEPGTVIEKHNDNLIIRVTVPEIKAELMDYRDNSGYFYEYKCNDLLEIKDFCNDKRCQTIAYIGERNMFRPLIESGVQGIDRIVPMGKTMDFDLIWDGYNLPVLLTRTITLL